MARRAPPSEQSQLQLGLGRPAEAPAGKAPAAAEPPEVLTVARLDRLIKRVLEGSTMGVRVTGEVSGLHRAGSGHCYFSLKAAKEDAIIDCVMYRSAPARARKLLKDGETVVLAGRVTIYAPRGRMQFIADDLLGSARGALLEALEKLKRQLEKEGLFAPERKKPLPKEPRCIAVLTSAHGAAIHDVIRVAFRRGRVRVLLVPTPVQGAGAGEKIARAIASTDRLDGIDALLVTRGGGSAEDLAAYNDEQVVRAIAAARHPVVSAVGHEIDVSLADLAADARAATPSQAAELLVPNDAERYRTLEHMQTRLRRAIRHRITSSERDLGALRAGLGEPRRLVLEQAQRFDELHARLERAARRDLTRRRSSLERDLRRLSRLHPRQVMDAARLRLRPLPPRLNELMRARLHGARRKLGEQAARLDAMSPLAVLERGYAIATAGEGRVLRDAADADVDQTIEVRLHRGRLAARITGVTPSDDD
jgi:exodeoxyribonuclease VII large subunit